MRSSKSSNKKNISPMYYVNVIIALIATITAIHAWFIMFVKTSTEPFIINIGGVEMQYDFYVYQDPLYGGSDNYSISNLCDDEQCLARYQKVNVEEEPYMFGTPNKVLPGNKFSFVMKITNVGTEDVMLKINMSGLSSTGANIPENKVQRAFYYSVEMITYYDDIDVKDDQVIEYTDSHFDTNNDSSYPLVSNVFVSSSDEAKKVIYIFFDLYFDPNISGYTTDLQPTGNSNAFANQFFSVSHLVCTVDKVKVS